MTRIAIVTGAGRGLGRNNAISIAATAATSTSPIAAVNRKLAAWLRIEALGGKAVALQLDVGDVPTFPAFVEKVRTSLKSTSAATRSTCGSPTAEVRLAALNERLAALHVVLAREAFGHHGVDGGEVARVRRLEVLLDRL